MQPRVLDIYCQLLMQFNNTLRKSCILAIEAGYVIMVSSLFLKDLEDSFIKSNSVKSRIFIDNSASVLQSELSSAFQPCRSKI